MHVASKYYIRTMLSLGRCLLITNICYAIIRCTVPPTVSPAWSQGMPGTYIIYIVRRLCLSRGIEWAIRVYARRQGTTFWFIPYRTMYIPPFNYNILTNIPIPVDIIPSPNPNIPLSSAVPPSSLPSTVYATTSPNHILPPHLRSYTPSIQNKVLGTW